MNRASTESEQDFKYQDETPESFSAENNSFSRTKEKLNRVLRLIGIVGTVSSADVARGESMEEYLGELPPAREERIVSREEREKLHYLWYMFGTRAVDELVDQEVTRETESTPGPRIDNPDRRYFKDEDLQTLFVRTFPKNWVKSEFDAVKFSSNAFKLPKQYGINKYQSGEFDFGGQRAGVTIYQHAVSEFTKVMTGVYPHETGHGNDYIADSTLPYEDRLELWFALSKHFFGDVRVFPSTYVKEIKNDNPNTLRRLQVQEYWAEICEAYLTDPDGLRKYPAAFTLVETWIKKQDAAFDVYSAIAEREEVLLRYRLELLPLGARTAIQIFQQKWLEEKQAEPGSMGLLRNMLDHQRMRQMRELCKKFHLSDGDQLWFARVTNTWVNSQLSPERQSDTAQ